MKLSFTIRHWPGMDWGQFCAAAADSRLAGDRKSTRLNSSHQL